MGLIRILLLIIFIKSSIANTDCNDSLVCENLRANVYDIRCHLSAQLEGTEPEEHEENTDVRGNAISIHYLPPVLQSNLLNLRECEISTIENGAFRKLNELLELDLSNNKLRELNEEAFGNLRSLRKLYLDGNRIKEIKNGAFSGMTSLEVLHLQNNRLTSVSTDLPQSLIELDVSNNKLHSLSIHSGKLSRLNLCKNPIKEVPTDIYSLVNITELCLGDNINEISPNETQAPWPHLKKFTLSARNLTEKPMMSDETQQTIQEFSLIQYLHLDNFKIHNFLFLFNLIYIKTLKLQNIEMADNSGSLPHLPYLETLDLESSPNIEKILFRTPYLYPQLTTLSLRNTRIQYVENYEIHSIHPNLRELYLQGNPLDCEPERWQHVLPILQKTPISQENTKCENPVEVRNMNILEAVNYLNRDSIVRQMTITPNDFTSTSTDNEPTENNFSSVSQESPELHSLTDNSNRKHDNIDILTTHAATENYGIYLLSSTEKLLKAHDYFEPTEDKFQMTTEHFHTGLTESKSQNMRTHSILNNDNDQVSNLIPEPTYDPFLSTGSDSLVFATHSPGLPTVDIEIKSTLVKSTSSKHFKETADNSGIQSTTEYYYEIISTGIKSGHEVDTNMLNEKDGLSSNIVSVIGNNDTHLMTTKSEDTSLRSTVDYEKNNQNYQTDNSPTANKPSEYHDYSYEQIENFTPVNGQQQTKTSRISKEQTGDDQTSIENYIIGGSVGLVIVAVMITTLIYYYGFHQSGSMTLSSPGEP